MPHLDYPDLMLAENFIAASCQRYSMLEQPFKDTFISDMIDDGLWALDPTTKTVRCTLDKRLEPMPVEFGSYDNVWIDNKYDPGTEVKASAADNLGFE